MEILSYVPVLNSSVVGLGFFDGVHIGHKKLIESVVSTAKKMNVPSVIITFKKSPAEKFIKDVKYITTNAEKRKIMGEHGIDYLIELPFSNTIINTSDYDFIKYYLKDKLNAKCIITGFNYTFGKNRVGTVKTLYKYQNEFDYKYLEIQPVKYKNNIVSSTLIKKILSDGNMEMANSLLGRNFKFSGKVIYGEQLGQKLGYPTANLIYDIKKADIPFGVYTVNVCISKKYYKGLMNFGIRPTLNNSTHIPVAEIHILNFNKNIYNKNIEVEVIKKIRDEVKFASLDELKIQIAKDLEVC